MVALQLSTPVTMWVTQLKLAAPLEGTQLGPYVYAALDSRLGGWFYAEGMDGLELIECEREDDALPDEGDMMFFF